MPQLSLQRTNLFTNPGTRRNNTNTSKRTCKMPYITLKDEDTLRNRLRSNPLTTTLSAPTNKNKKRTSQKGLHKQEKLTKTSGKPSLSDFHLALIYLLLEATTLAFMVLVVSEGERSRKSWPSFERSSSSKPSVLQNRLGMQASFESLDRLPGQVSPSAAKKSFQIVVFLPKDQNSSPFLIEPWNPHRTFFST